MSCEARGKGRTAALNEGVRKLSGEVAAVVCRLAHRLAQEDNLGAVRFRLRDADVALDMADFVLYRLHGIATKPKFHPALLSMSLLPSREVS